MELFWQEPNRRVGWVDVMAMLGVVGLLTARFIPVARWIPGWGCGFRLLTGWPCPGCGLTRAAEAVAHGRWSDAFAIHPLGTLAAAAIFLCILFSGLHLAFGLPLPRVTVRAPALRWAFGSLTLGGMAVNYAYLIASMRFGWELPWR